MKKYLLLFCLILSCLVACDRPVKTKLPKTLLWVWEARQDLRSLNPNQVGVAVYAGTVTLNQSGVIISRSQQKMAFPPKIYRMAVIHLSVSPHAHPALNQKTVEQTVAAIMEIASHSGMNDLQLDFSATKSQQSFYADVIRLVKMRLPRESMLSITALANWCVGDRWIAKNNLPVDLVVPMYFSLSANEREKNQFTQRFPTNIRRLAPECQHAIGVATFERWQIPLRAEVPVFVFTQGAWTPELIRQAFVLSRSVNSRL